MEHNNRLTLGQLIIGALLGALFLSLIPMLDERPAAPMELRHKTVSEADQLKVKLCFEAKRDFNNQDLNHFCRGTK